MSQSRLQPIKPMSLSQLQPINQMSLSQPIKPMSQEVQPSFLSKISEYKFIIGLAIVLVALIGTALYFVFKKKDSSPTSTSPPSFTRTPTTRTTNPPGTTITTDPPGTTITTGPPGDFPDGSTCNSNSQCKSGYCDGILVRRCVPQGTPQTSPPSQIYLDDGSTCDNNFQCKSGYCSAIKQCDSLRDKGHTCNSNSQCKSGLCAGRPIPKCY